MNNIRSKSHKPLLILAITTVITVAVVYCFMQYRVNVSVSKAEQAMSTVKLGQIDKNNEQELTKIYNDTVSDRARLSNIFIPADKVVSFIETVESIGPETGIDLSISSINADSLDGAPSGKLGAIQAKIIAHGSWAGTMRALIIAESLPYDISINNVRLDTSTAGPGQNGKHVWDISFDIQATLIAK